MEFSSPISRDTDTTVLGSGPTELSRMSRNNKVHFFLQLAELSENCSCNQAPTSVDHSLHESKGTLNYGRPLISPEIAERAHVKFVSRKEGDTRSIENCKIDAVQKSFNGIYSCTLKKAALPKRRLRLF